MIEFTVGSATYRTDRKLTVFQQHDVVRRIAPLFAGLAGSMSSSPQQAAADIGAALFANMGPLTDALASMSDSSSDYVLKTCLSVVSRQHSGGTGWARLTTSTGDMMFEDIDLLALYQIVWKVLEENLAGFFGGLATPSAEAGPEQPAALN